MADDLGPVLKAAYPQVVATLSRLLGDVDRAADVTQDALVVALQKWQAEGIPRNPVGWLVTVGRNRAVDQYRREAKSVSIDSNVVSISEQVDYSTSTAFDPEDFLHPFEDDLVRLVFTCCHPVLNETAQICLVLKVVLGLSVDEIARALLTSRATVEKRISRAKAKLKQARVEFDTPTVDELDGRLQSALRAIYLLFNEGYTRISDTQLAHNRLMDEAIRLARMTCRALRQNPQPRRR